LRIDNLSASGDIAVNFRAADIFKNCTVAVFADGKRVGGVAKRILTPGEMGEIRLRHSMFTAGLPSQIELRIEEAQRP